MRCFLSIWPKLLKLVHYKESSLVGLVLVISHLFFEDDALYFMKTTFSNCWALKNIIDKFCLVSGQLINHAKSSIYFSPNTPTQMQHLMCELIGIQLVNHPGHYLGMPTLWRKSKKEALIYIKDRISSKIDDWKLCYFFLLQVRKFWSSMWLWLFRLTLCLASSFLLPFAMKLIQL